MTVERDFGVTNSKNGRKSALENYILINIVEDGCWVVVAGERACVSDELFFKNIEEAYYYAISRLRSEKEHMDRMREKYGNREER